MGCTNTAEGWLVHFVERVYICDGCGSALDGTRVPGMAEVSLLQCECGLVITSPRPTPAELGEYYPATYYSYVARAPTLKRRFLSKLRTYKGGYPTSDAPISRAFWRAAASLLGNLFLFYLPYLGNGKRLLEIGCGTGADLLWAHGNGWDVSGLEISEQAVDVARRQGLDVQCSTFENADLAAASFDCIIMSQVLEHLYSPRQALRRCYDLLRPGGQLLIAIPKFDSWGRFALGNYWRNLLFPIHLYHFSQSVLERMVSEAGFSVREVRLSFGPFCFFNALKSMKQFNIWSRLFTPPRGTLSDVMLVIARKP